MRISDWSSDVCSSDLLAAARLLHRCHPDAAQHHRGHAHHGLRLRAGRLPAAADSRPAAALDPLGADHRPGGLSVQHALRCGHGGLPGADLAGAGRPHAVGRRPAGGDGMTPSWLRRGYMALIALFLMAPLIVVFGVSLNEKQSLLFPPEGLSLDWYAEIFTDDGWRGALFASVGLADTSRSEEHTAELQYLMRISYTI